MKYKITIRKCADIYRAQEIAKGIAKWSGSSPDVVFKVITEKPVCIKREAEEEEAFRIKAQFEAYGAEVELIPLQSEAAVAAAAASVASAARASTSAPKKAQVPVIEFKVG